MSLADLGAKHCFLRAGLGWGGMPLDVVTADHAGGQLVQPMIDDLASRGHVMSLSAVYPTVAPPGPAGRWLIERLRGTRPCLRRDYRYARFMRCDPSIP